MEVNNPVPRSTVGMFLNGDLATIWNALTSGATLAKAKIFPLPVNGVAPVLPLSALLNSGGAVADYKFVFGGLISSALIIANVIDNIVILKNFSAQFRIVNADANTVTIEGFYIFIFDSTDRPTMAYVQLEQSDTLLAGTNKTFKISTSLPLNNGQSQNPNLLEVAYEDFSSNAIAMNYAVYVKVSGAVASANVTIDNINEPRANVIGRTV